MDAWVVVLVAIAALVAVTIIGWGLRHLPGDMRSRRLNDQMYARAVEGGQSDAGPYRLPPETLPPTAGVRVPLRRGPGPRDWKAAIEYDNSRE